MNKINTTRAKTPDGVHSHESLVVVADLLDVDVELAVNVWLGGAVGGGEGGERGEVQKLLAVLGPGLADAAVRVAQLHDHGVAGRAHLQSEPGKGRLHVELCLRLCRAPPRRRADRCPAASSTSRGRAYVTF